MGTSPLQSNMCTLQLVLSTLICAEQRHPLAQGGPTKVTPTAPTCFPKEFENKTKTEQQQKRFAQPVQTDGQLCNSQYRDRFYKKRLTTFVPLQIRRVGLRFVIVSVHRLLWNKIQLTDDMFIAPFKKRDALGIPRRCVCVCTSQVICLSITLKSKLFLVVGG